MFITYTVGEELTSYCGKLMAENDTEKEKYALIALKLIVDEWELVKENVQKSVNFWCGYLQDQKKAKCLNPPISISPE